MSDVLSASAAGADIDKDVRRFAEAISQAYATYPPLGQLSLEEARSVCETIRAPWAEGGPQTAMTTRLIDTPHGAVRVRVHDPAPGSGPKPALVYLHGGGWVLFSLDTHDRLMREYAARSGLVVVGVDYARSPEAKFPVALEQTIAAMRWLLAFGDQLGVDPGLLAAGGDSAGANLALTAALALRDAGEGRLLSALLLNYGAFDDVCTPEDVRRYGASPYTLTASELTGFFSAYLRGPTDRDNPLARPVLARLEGLPPTFFTTPACDVLTEQSHAMARRMARAGVAVTERTYAGATHSFLEAVSISDLAARALQDGADWLHACLNEGRDDKERGRRGADRAAELR